LTPSAVVAEYAWAYTPQGPRNITCPERIYVSVRQGIAYADCQPFVPTATAPTAAWSYSGVTGVSGRSFRKCYSENFVTDRSHAVLPYYISAHTVRNGACGYNYAGYYHIGEADGPHTLATINAFCGREGWAAVWLTYDVVKRWNPPPGLYADVTFSFDTGATIWRSQQAWVTYVSVGVDGDGDGRADVEHLILYPHYYNTYLPLDWCKGPIPIISAFVRPGQIVGYVQNCGGVLANITYPQVVKVVNGDPVMSNVWAIYGVNAWKVYNATFGIPLNGGRVVGIALMQVTRLFTEDSEGARTYWFNLGLCVEDDRIAVR